jgi:hypothetical protein
MIINNLVGIFTFLRGLDITKQKMMKRLQRSFSKSKENSVVSNDKKNIENFYRMLLKFEKRHPDFNAKKLIQKLYPTLDLDSFL